MGIIVNQMWLWLLLCGGVMAITWIYHNKKTDKGLDTSSDFSGTTMFFDPIKGEGDVFIGGVLALIFFSLFLLEFTRVLSTLIV